MKFRISILIRQMFLVKKFNHKIKIQPLFGLTQSWGCGGEGRGMYVVVALPLTHLRKSVGKENSIITE